MGNAAWGMALRIMLIIGAIAAIFGAIAGTVWAFMKYPGLWPLWIVVGVIVAYLALVAVLYPEGD